MSGGKERRKEREGGREEGKKEKREGRKAGREGEGRMEKTGIGTKWEGNRD